MSSLILLKAVSCYGNQSNTESLSSRRRSGSHTVLSLGVNLAR